MREEAERYCALIEGAEAGHRRSFAFALADSLAALLSAAWRLPDVAPSSCDLPDGPDHEQWLERFAALQEVLGEWGDYWTTVDPHDEDGSIAVLLPVADDLADIWRDLKPGLLGLHSGAGPNDVTWHWRFGFYSHWGRHATEALRALHARLADDGGPLYRRPAS
jgi:hypothetical protein